jgi:hypothetical protein
LNASLLFDKNGKKSAKQKIKRNVQFHEMHVMRQSVVLIVLQKKREETLLYCSINNVLKTKTGCVRARMYVCE